uniref:CSON009466 protein n=1 Tax=Culicoides sonorensis TaxID=179676 RepID=A0A336M2S2_CULSO
MPLKGIKVVEFVGLAPGPFCGKILADFGALVTRIDKSPVNQIDVFQEGKRTIALNLKHAKAQEIAKKICLSSDVVLEPFRPGVMERLNLGPNELLKQNKRLIYACLTGFGQSGSLSQRAGHDINYVALSGILSLLGRKSEKPTPPINILADLAGGSLMCAFGIVAALFERAKSGKGQIIDAAMVDGTAYIGSWLMKSQEMPMKVCGADNRGENVLDSGYHFYDTYETKDGKFMSVGAIEPQFYEDLIKVLNLDGELDQFSDNEKLKEIFTEKFKTKTQSEWTAIFNEVDACVFPVLTPEEARNHSHNRERETFLKSGDETDTVIINPAPKLSRTPAELAKSRFKQYNSDYVREAEEILNEIGIKKSELKKLQEDDIVRFESSNNIHKTVHHTCKGYKKK